MKQLPRNEDGTYKREFTANGKKFIIKSPDEDLGIFRFSHLRKYGAMTGANGTFKSIITGMQEAQNLLMGDKPILGRNKECFTYLENLITGITKTNELRYQFAFYMATFFIVRPDEDLTKWDIKEQETKIDDWNKDFGEKDFLALALSRVEGFLNVYRNLTEKANKAKEVLGGSRLQPEINP